MLETVTSPGFLWTERQARGFSLAELLLALVILGQIAVFAIPKVLAVQQDARRKAVFKEALGALSEVVYTGVVTGELNGANDHVYVLEHINAARQCPSQNSLAGGCWTHDLDIHPDSWVHNETGFMMHNGLTFSGLDSADSSDHEQCHLDWNGAEGPNLNGVDQMSVDLCYRDGVCAGTRNQAGTITPTAGNADSIALYEAIFAN